MPRHLYTAVLVLALVMSAGPPAYAQRVLVDVFLQRSVDRFPEDVVANRLDGAATGWGVGASALMHRHIALDVEWSDGGQIDDEQTTTLTLNGRAVTIASSLVHRTRAFVVLGGFTHAISTRVRLAYLAGVAATHVRREFASTAGDLLLVFPSNTPPRTQTVTDRFAALAAGVDARVRLVNRLHAVAAVRVQQLDLGPDERGVGVRTLAGAGWTF